MKKAVILFLICFLAVLPGCQSKPAVNQTAKNANGTPAVNLPANTDRNANADTSGTGSIPAHDSLSDGSGDSVPASDDDMIVIKEKMFVAQTNDIYFNAQDYLGKTIKYEGIFNEFVETEGGTTYYSVIRYGPGCCGIDANSGFEVRWEANTEKEYPQPNDWVEVVGVLERYKENDFEYLRLNLVSLKVLPVRGAEYVSQ